MRVRKQVLVETLNVGKNVILFVKTIRLAQDWTCVTRKRENAQITFVGFVMCERKLFIA